MPACITIPLMDSATLNLKYPFGLSLSKPGAALRHFMLLDELRAAVDGGVAPGDAVNGARPPVFFKRKGKVETALGLWSPARLARAIIVLGEAARDARLNPSLSADIVGETLLTLARAADQAAGRRRR